ncbi:MAG: S-adenosyl-l-methionine hydroxide adenosyltransferase family protein [Thermofilaceae archaeon]
MLKNPVITLLTDFGARDHYVGSMKGVILSIAPHAVIIDITHCVPKFDVRAGAFLLKAAYKYFPPGTIHVAVVDPGVGTQRRSIAIKTNSYIFIGPDNGLLAPAALEDGVQEVRLIENPRLTRGKVSRTFHGRDIFAPVAAYLACGLPFEEVGPLIEDGLNVPSFAHPEVRAGYLACEVMYIDDFGNVVLNATANDVERAGLTYGTMCRIELKGSLEIVAPFLPTYGYVAEGETLLLINSEDHLELAVNKGNAATRYGLATGDRVAVKALP